MNAIAGTYEKIASLEEYMEASSSLLHDTTPKVADLSARTRALRSLLEENHSRTNDLDQMLQNGYRTVESMVVGTKLGRSAT